LITDKKYLATSRTGLVGLARGFRNLLGFKERSFINYFVGEGQCEKFYLCVCFGSNGRF